MARGSKDYDKRTHAASKKDWKGKQKEVWDMIGAKKKLHEMVEALINSDSKTAASALHDYLQVKTRQVLGEEDMEGDHEDDMVADRHDDEEGDEHEEGGEECEHCGAHPCECDDEHEDEMGSDDEHEEHGAEEGGGMFEGNLTMAKKGHYMTNAAPHLDRKVKGKVNYEKTAGSGTKKSNSTGSTPPFKKAHNNAAPELSRKVKGKVNFEKSSGSGSKKSNSTEATPTMKGAHTNAAKDLNRKQKGATKFSSSPARKNG
jgi:hypothetical protein